MIKVKTITMKHQASDYCILPTIKKKKKDNIIQMFSEN